jgi:hypothetical protein
MKFEKRMAHMKAVAVLTGALLCTGAALAQDYGPPPLLAPQQLDALVGRIALYPDPLLAQVLAAATYTDQIPDAAQWADAHRYLQGDALAAAIEQSNLPWDVSVQALIPFPDVLDTMARDMNWTADLGNAVLAQRPDVMDAVQRMRREAEEYGYLRSNEQVRVVDASGSVEIVPYDPAVIYVPVYDPYIVYAPPRPGFYIGTAIRFPRGFTIGVFGRFGWGGSFNWRQHTVIVNRAAWDRNWSNRGGYVDFRSGHAYRPPAPPARPAPPVVRRPEPARVYNPPPVREAYRQTTPPPTRNMDRPSAPPARTVTRPSAPQPSRQTERSFRPSAREDHGRAETRSDSKSHR